MRMDRKGDVPTILVFVGALILVITALWSFATYDGRQVRPLENIDLVSNSLNSLQNYFYANIELFMQESLKDVADNGGSLEQKFKNSADKHDLRIGNTNLFALIRTGKFYITNDAGGFDLRIDNVFIKLENDVAKGVRTFNIDMKFDGNGNRILSK